MAQHSRYTYATTQQPRLWLATEDGETLPPPRESVNAIIEAEVPLEIQFEGLSLEQQRAALTGFPGGRRFVLSLRD